MNYPEPVAMVALVTVAFVAVAFLAVAVAVAASRVPAAALPSPALQMRFRLAGLPMQPHRPRLPPHWSSSRCPSLDREQDQNQNQNQNQGQGQDQNQEQGQEQGREPAPPLWSGMCFLPFPTATLSAPGSAASRGADRSPCLRDWWWMSHHRLKRTENHRRANGP